MVFLVAFYGPILRDHLSLERQQKVIQAYLDKEDFQEFFACDRVYGEGGNAPFSSWPEEEDGVIPFTDLRGRPWTYTMNHGSRLVPGAAARAGKPRIVILGESSAFGFGLHDDQTLAAYLQQAVGNAYQVINLASIGLEMETLLSHWGRVTAAKPSILVVAMSQNCLRDYLTVARCRGILTVPILTYRPSNPKALLQAGIRWHDWWKRKVRGEEPADLERVLPERYRRNLTELVRRAESTGVAIVFLEHEFIFRQIETVPGFREIRSFREQAKGVAEKFNIPYVRMSENIGKVDPGGGETEHNYLSEMISMGYTEEELDQVFFSPDAFIDLLHPTSGMNRVLAEAIQSVIPPGPSLEQG